MGIREYSLTSKCYKGTRYKSRFGGFKTDITHDRILGASVNIPTKVFCFYTFGRIDWVGWRLTRREDGRGWPRGGSQEYHHFSGKMSAKLRHLITSLF